MPRGNPSPKSTITIDPDVHEIIITSAAREAMQRRTGLAAVEQWEKQHVRLSQQEMADARQRVLTQQRKPASGSRRPV